ncbi:phage shock protein operon transcriptional activator [Desulfocurvibacter africanus]|uniref:Sigma54 specific transcriptional activator, PspF, Fis family n=1 Tax=Desulfocurvibacter africanus subsp. africanus str. Walvis Bay TaxID=690850 RepID=F3YZ15_DESAF|nr:phage shock protein operon transcriptional activator [Desulfocurvibacter africanus]EGJ49660.1 sigma54 specific transcriptional activator, PspF, Fis family [Desulfocurvibacter africanus subsp. africanus str. Walvis Bay]
MARDSNSYAPAYQEALGSSEAFLRCQERLSLAAKVNRPLLIIGERGTGKELAARKVHYLSPRWRQPLVTLNCAALAPTLIESELFGHEAGAFTGAQGRRAGRFEEAHDSTLFLDEIGAIPLEAQEKILRVVEYGTFERVGGSRTVEVDVRIVAATNADLPALAEAGRFKRDLLDRLAFEVIHIPPLRERGEDVLLLARHFAGRMAAELSLGQSPRFSRQAERALLAHGWPGNVRELKNVVERSLFRAGGPLIRDVALSPFEDCGIFMMGRGSQPDASARESSTQSLHDLSQPSSALPDSGVSFQQAVREFELSLVRSALAAARHNQRKAAGLLGLSYDQFRGLYRKFIKEFAE